MSLTPGTKLGPYEILSLIGAGGMGEVYKAKDTRLDRIVAIKVLPSHLAESPERRERFEREARAVSSLNHPHICTLHDIGEQDGTHFLVMEYIDGETLADRLQKGPLPLDQALRYGIEIADALDKAHRQGVVHRDLKPGNIMLSKSGAKLLDFGLAKLKESRPGQDASVLSALPTEQKPLTKEGSILGTFQYMAPEQLEGKEADARTDIFAFGSVLYEMVTGKRAFEGKSQASLISAIMTSEPPLMSELEPLSPAALDRVVTKCLAKLGEHRWQTALDLRDELEWIREGSIQPEGIDAVDKLRSKKRERLAWVAALITSAVVAGIAVRGLMLPSPPAPRPIKRFTISLPQNVSLPAAFGSLLALSSDGTKLAFVGSRGGNVQLFLRSMDELEARALPDTEGARHPAFSPLGNTIAFDIGQPIIVSLTSGLRVALADAGIYPTWSPNGDVFFWNSGLWRVPAEGGEPQALMDSQGVDSGTGRPKVLPNGKAVLFQGRGTIEVLSLETSEQRSLVSDGTNPHYVSTGHILFARAGSLFAVPFDAERLRVSGPAAPILADLRIESGGAAQFTVSSDGSLVYARESASVLEGTLVRVDRQGRARAITEKKHRFRNPRLSPDGSRVAVSVAEATRSDIWIHEIDRDILKRLTFERSSLYPIWSPDGTRLAFDSSTGQGSQVFVKSVGGSGDVKQLTTEIGRPYSWSSDGNVVILDKSYFITGRDVDLIRLDGDSKRETLLGTRFDETQAALSPDDRWLAYTSNESGRSEVFAVSFPDASRRWQISTEGGTEPMWSRDGSELFYRNGDNMMSVSIDREPELTFAKPFLLFEVRYAKGDRVANYDVTTDGEGFIMIRQEEGGARVELNVVLNWFEELQRLVPTN